MRSPIPIPKELAGRYADTTRENFTNTMVISCFSFTEIAKRAAELMPNGGSMITLSYGGATRWVPSYNVMGVAKAALEASVRYLAADLGPQGIRVNALSAGPMRTLSGAGVSDARVIFNFQRDNSPLKRTPTLDEVGGSALYLLSPLSGAVTGEVHFVDCGYNTVSMPTLAELEGAGHRRQTAAERIAVRSGGVSRALLRRVDVLRAGHRKHSPHDRGHDRRL